MSRTIDTTTFRGVLGHVPTGVVVVAAFSGDQPVGLAVGSFFSVSLSPALVGWCPDKRSSSWPAIRASGAFCVSVLAEDQRSICERLAKKGEAKFAGIAWERTTTGAVRIPHAHAWIDCDIEVVHDAGDHEICVGRVRELGLDRPSRPLVFYRGGYGTFDG